MQPQAVSPAGFELYEFDSDAGVASRASIGLVVLSSDQTIEHEFREITRSLDKVGIYVARVAMDNQVTPETLAAMEKRIAEATGLILPGIDLDVVAYGCTSASMVIGEEKVFGEIRKARPNVSCTTPITAGFAALRALGAARIAVLTPYSDDVNQQVRHYIETSGGFEVSAFGSFNEDDDRRAARISETSIVDAACTLGERDDVDGVFISCTSLRVARVAGEVERRIGKPVTGSNHAMAWHALRIAGVDDTLPEFGQLFTLPVTAA